MQVEVKSFNNSQMTSENAHLFSASQAHLLCFNFTNLTNLIELLFYNVN